MKKLFRIFFFLTFLYFLFVIFDFFIQKFYYNLTDQRDPQVILLENKLNEKKILERKVTYNNGLEILLFLYIMNFIRG